MPCKPASVVDIGGLDVCLQLDEGPSPVLGPAERPAEVGRDKRYDGVHIVSGYRHRAIVSPDQGIYMRRRRRPPMSPSRKAPAKTARPAASHLTAFLSAKIATTNRITATSNRIDLRPSFTSIPLLGRSAWLLPLCILPKPRIGFGPADPSRSAP